MKSHFNKMDHHGGLSLGLHLHWLYEGCYWEVDSGMKTRPAGIGSANADWMGSLSSKLSAMPLKHLAVPGKSGCLAPWTLTFDRYFAGMPFTVSATFDPRALHVFQALMILSPTGWMCMPLWDLTRSGLWSTWPQCSVCLPKKSWWSGPWLRYWLNICSKSKRYKIYFF